MQLIVFFVNHEIFTSQHGKLRIHPPCAKEAAVLGTEACKSPGWSVQIDSNLGLLDLRAIA